jgi:ferrous iron transport protein B
VEHHGVQFSEAALSPGGKRRLSELLRGILREHRRSRRAQTQKTPDPRVHRLLAAPDVTNLFGDEKAARAVRTLLLTDEIDTVLVVADAKNLWRSLALVLQVAAFGVKTVVDLNMVDEARDRGQTVDVAALADLLSTEVVPTVAIMGEGLPRLRPALRRGRIPSVRVDYPKKFAAALAAIQETLCRPDASPTAATSFVSAKRIRALALCLLLDDPEAWALAENAFSTATVDRITDLVEAEWRKEKGAPPEQIAAEAAYATAERLEGLVTQKAAPEPVFLSRLGRWAAHPLYGLPIALLVLVIAYLWVGTLGAGIMVDLLDQKLFRELMLPLTARALEPVPWPIVRDAIIDPDFGLLPTGLFLAVGLLLPVLLFFNVFFAVLEDSGYLPRLSVLLDRGLRRLGLNGQGVLPLVLGFSCVTMALLTTRTLKTRKERIIASMLLLGLPCAPLLAVSLAVLQPLSWTAPLTFFLLILIRGLVLGMLGNRFIPGRAREFIMELPTLRIPNFKRILPHAFNRTLRFMGEALPVFLLASAVLFTLDRLGGLTLLERAADPLVHTLLGLPDQAVQVFLKTIIRRENGAAELSLVRDHFDGVQILVTLVIMTFIMPCINAAIVLVKERGLKTALLLIFFQVGVALIAGTALHRICRLLDVTFR